jgi:uncharacterized protein YhaN
VSPKLTITMLRLDGFGCFGPKPFELRFAPNRLNLIVGSNETGKSTLVRALFGILFGIKDSNEEQRFAPWHNGGRIYKGTLELKSADSEITITRDFLTNHTQIVARQPRRTRELFNDAANPRSAKLYNVYLTELQKLCVVQDEELFYATTVIRQADVQAEMTDKLRQLITGAAETDYVTVRERLKSLHDDLTVHRPWTKTALRNPRQIEELRDAIQRKRQALSEVESQLRRFAACKEEFDQLEQTVRMLEADINSSRERLRTMDRLIELLRDELTLRERVGRIEKDSKRIRGMEEEKRRLERTNQEQYAEFVNAPEDLGEQLQRLQRLEERCKHLKENQARLAEQREQAERFLAAEQRQREQFARFYGKPLDFPDRLAAHKTTHADLKCNIEKLEEEIKQCDSIFPAWANLSCGALTLLDRTAEKILGMKEIETRLEGVRQQIQWFRRRQRLAALLSLGLGVAGALVGSLLLGPVAGILAGLVLGLVLFFVLSLSFAPREELGKVMHHQRMLEDEYELARQAGKELQAQLGTEAVPNPEVLRQLVQHYHAARPVLEEIRLLDADSFRAESAGAIRGKNIKEMLAKKVTQLHNDLDEVLKEIKGFETTEVDDAFRAAWNEYLQLAETFRSKSSELKVLCREEEETDRQLQEEENAMRAAKDRLRDILKGRTAEVVLRAYEVYQRHNAGLVQLREALARDESPEALEKEHDSLRIAFDSIQRQLREFVQQFPALGLWRDRPTDLQRERDELNNKVQNLEKDIDRKRQRLADVRAELKACERVDRDVERLQEEVRNDEQQLARLEHRRDAIGIAIGTLETCIGEYQDQYFQELAQQIESTFTEIVGVRYQNFEFTEQFDTLLFSTPEARELTDASLSQGARDQLYFAMRLATARELAAQVTLPFILDDPFVNFDRDRLKRVMDMLVRIAQTQQVILLTHGREYARWENPIMDLDEYQRENAQWGKAR